MEWTRGQIIGHGSSATVSLATSLRSGDIFAAKSTDLSKSEFLQREQKFLSSLNSPHIITYKGSDITCEGSKLMYNIFLEHASGGTLADEIRRHGGRLNESMIVRYTRQILQGLEYLHSNGVVHCDIKSRNILITESGAKIADFGCAKWESEAVQSGGTPMFMAPEVARGEHQGFACDIWAIGCIVIEMASGGGALWPDATDPVTVLYRIANSGEVPEFPSYLSKQAKDFLSNCLRRDPKERWAASQLLKHPFLEGFNSCTEQIQEPNSNCSPTSVLLDQGIWNSVEETEESLGNLIRSSSKISACERIKRLSCSLQGSSWDWDESWITVRENENEESISITDEIEAKDDMICGSVLASISGRLEEQESIVNKIRVSTLSSKVNSSVSSSNLILQRHKDILLFPLISKYFNSIKLQIFSLYFYL